MQLELFDEAIPGLMRLERYRARTKRPSRTSRRAASVAVFPLSRQLSTLDAVERALLELRGARKLQFWRSTLSSIRSRLSAAGVAEDVITAELWSLHAALERRLNVDSNRHGGGAA